MTTTGSTYREKIETAARAKVFWGDSREDVIKHLTDNGFTAEEANTMVETFFDERFSTLRKWGIKKMFIGLGILALGMTPWLGLCWFMHRFYMPPLPAVLALATALVYGAFSCLKGSMMYMWPKNEIGDVGTMD
jgi:hypothetical protein